MSKPTAELLATLHGRAKTLEEDEPKFVTRKTAALCTSEVEGTKKRENESGLYRDVIIGDVLE